MRRTSRGAGCRAWRQNAPKSWIFQLDLAPGVRSEEPEISDNDDDESNIKRPTPCLGKRPQRPKPKGPGRPWGQKPLAHGRTVEGVRTGNQTKARQLRPVNAGPSTGPESPSTGPHAAELLFYFRGCPRPVFLVFFSCSSSDDRGSGGVLLLYQKATAQAKSSPQCPHPNQSAQQERTSKRDNGGRGRVRSRIRPMSMRGCCSFRAQQPLYWRLGGRVGRAGRVAGGGGGGDGMAEAQPARRPSPHQERGRPRLRRPVPPRRFSRTSSTNRRPPSRGCMRRRCRPGRRGRRSRGPCCSTPSSASSCARCRRPRRRSRCRTT